MSVAAKPLQPWYWLLIKEQQDTNDNLLQLCKDQQKLLLYMEKELAAKGINDSLTSRGSSTTDAVRRMGPDSIPINWIGGLEDSIPITVDDIDLNGQVVTQQMVKDWNTIFKLTSRIDGYEKAIDSEVKPHDEALHYLQEMAESGEGVGDEKEVYEALVRETEDRMYDVLQPQMRGYVAALRSARNRIYCTTRHFLLKKGLLDPDDNLWKETLFESEPQVTRENNRVPVYDQNKCPFEQDLPDLWF